VPRDRAPKPPKPLVPAVDADETAADQERLRDLIRKARGGSAREIAEAIEKTVDEYRGHGTQQDDITFVAIRVK